MNIIYCHQLFSTGFFSHLYHVSNTGLHQLLRKKKKKHQGPTHQAKNDHHVGAYGEIWPVPGGCGNERCGVSMSCGTGTKWVWCGHPDTSGSSGYHKTSCGRRMLYVSQAWLTNQTQCKPVAPARPDAILSGRIGIALYSIYVSSIHKRLQIHAVKECINACTWLWTLRVKPSSFWLGVEQLLKHIRNSSFPKLETIVYFWLPLIS